MEFGPHLQYERRLAREGYAVVCGIDEVGRGAWAGPIVAAAVVMPLQPRVNGVRDSKKLSAKQRVKLAARICNRARYYSVAYVPAQEIDEIGIVKANELVMRHAIEGLDVPPDYILVDAFGIGGVAGKQVGIPHGDAIVYSIAAASIVAKVARDNMMAELAQTYPEYGFEQHKGYGTAKHKQAIDIHGLTPLHRRSFQPMNLMV